MTIRVPCCGAPSRIDYAREGPAHMQEQVVDGSGCVADGCGSPLAR